jgi:succinate dehydrogenase / fumarate reductase iron-sulfur subunit
MNVHLKVWRQKDANSPGGLVDIEARNIPEDASFLEMLDIVNDDLVGKGEEPIAFDHDCREGICGTCSLTINGIPHGPSETTTCQLYMRKFRDGDTIYIEPFRARPFPVVRDLVVNREAYDRIQQAGGFITARAACPNGSAMLFVGAKVTHLAELPQGQPERTRRALAMVRQMDKEGFGNCTNYLECEAVCPAEIPATVINRLNREYLRAVAIESLT